MGDRSKAIEVEVNGRKVTGVVHEGPCVPEATLSKERARGLLAGVVVGVVVTIAVLNSIADVVGLAGVLAWVERNWSEPSALTWGVNLGGLLAGVVFGLRFVRRGW